MTRPILSPCIKVCFVDPAEQMCVGCFRTMEELARWTRYSDTERETICAGLKAREAAYQARRTQR